MASFKRPLFEILQTKAFKLDNLREDHREQFCKWMKGKDMSYEIDLDEMLLLCMSTGVSMDKLLSELNISGETTRDTFQFLSAPSFPQKSPSADDFLGSLSNSPNDITYRPRVEQITPPLPCADVAIVATSSPSAFISLSHLPHDKAVNVTRHRFVTSEQHGEATVSTLPVAAATAPPPPTTTTDPRRFQHASTAGQRREETGICFGCGVGFWGGG